MAELGRSKGALLLLLITVYCEAKALQSEITLQETENVTTPCPEELAEKLETLNKETDPNPATNAKPSDQSEDVTTPCPEELEKAKLADQAEKSNNFEANKSTSTESETETTICPEELRKRLETTTSQDSYQKNPVQQAQESESEPQDSTTPCPEELLQKQTQNKLELNKQPAADLLPPKQEQTTQFENQAETNQVLAGTLLMVQKDSALLKLVKDKLLETRSKRQTANYAPYYSNQPTYNSQGVALTAGQNTYNKGFKTSQSNQKTLQRAPVVSKDNIRTYQQIQRQYQSLYPKSYQNYVKPVQGHYQNIPHARHPSNSYYNKSGANRRQFQGTARPRTTSARPTRATIKKKFRPSPVFA